MNNETNLKKIKRHATSSSNKKLMPTMSMRNAEINDSESIAALSNQLGYISSSREIQKRLISILKSKEDCIYVAIDNEKLIGWIHGFYSLRIESDAFVEIGGLIVDENYRKKGIGKMLIKKINEWAKYKQCSSIRVRCNELRKESHLFYERQGFELNKVQKIFDKKLD